MEQIAIIERIHHILESTGNTANSLALKSEIDPSNLKKMLDGKQKISDKTIKKITNAFGISLDWLRNGNGQMLIDSVGELQERNTHAISSDNEEEGVYIVPLLPISAQGGSLNDFVASVSMHECEKVISPVKGADLAITISGDSMADEYPSGSIVLAKRINESAFIDWGKAYVLDTCNGTVVKILTPSEKNDYVRCVSINPNPIYAPFEVALNDIYGVYRVLLCMAKK